jgi:uncharacterized protein involved in type VI secretion and phage assembly
VKGDNLFNEDIDHEDTSAKIYGVVTAVVTNNKDDEGMARIKVTFPWLAENDESHWARIATMMAGNDRGTYFIPEIGDEVLVAFENGDINFPYVIGALWNGKDKVHEINSDGKNNLRVIKSRCGHKVIFDDTKGKEKITIIDYTENRKIVIDSEKKNIDIYNKDGMINMYAGGDINIQTSANLNIKASGDINTQADANINTKASSNISQKSGSSTKTEAGSTMNIKSGGVNTIKGSLIKLN